MKMFQLIRKKKAKPSGTHLFGCQSIRMGEEVWVTRRSGISKHGGK